MTWGDGICAGLHWLEGVSQMDSASVVRAVESVVGHQAEPGSRTKFYRKGWKCGPVTVLGEGVTGQAEAMGVFVRVSGEGCDELGLVNLAKLAQLVGLRCTRLDVAMDGGGFTPAKLAAAWKSGRVRTHVKVSAKAREGRDWRECSWESNSEGDTFYMGGKGAQRRACVYDRRGFTRFEMRYRGDAAAAVAADLLGDVGEGWATRAMGHVRAFVDFVSLGQANASRRPLLGWWAKFVGDAERARVRLVRQVVESFEVVRSWVERQVAPMLAVVAERLGPAEVKRLLRAGRSRWDARHYRMAGGFVPERSAFVGRVA